MYDKNNANYWEATADGQPNHPSGASTDSLRNQTPPSPHNKVEIVTTEKV